MATRIIRTDPASGIVRIVKHTMGKREQQEWRDAELRRLHAEEHVPATVLAEHHGLPLGYLVTHILDPAKPKQRKRKPKTVVIDPTKPKRIAQPGAVVPKRPQGRPRIHPERQPYAAPPGAKLGPGRPRKWAPGTSRKAQAG